MNKVIQLVALLSSSVLVCGDGFYKRPEGPPPNHFVPLHTNWTEVTPELIHPSGYGLAFFAALPSFRGDYSLSLYEDYDYVDVQTEEKGNFDSIFGTEQKKKKVSRGYFLSTKFFNRSLNIVTAEDLILSEKKIKVDQGLAIAINRIWVKTLLETAYPKVTNLGGLDGTTYIFNASGIHHGLQGTTWSPTSGSIPADMVDLANRLVELAKKEEAIPEKTVRELFRTIEALEKKLNSQPVRVDNPITAPGKYLGTGS